MPLTQWICCQLGAREHYAVPRALQQSGQLAALVTDAWVPPQSAFNKLPQSMLRGLRDRYHPDLSTAPIKAFTPSLLQFEAMHRVKKTPFWERITQRNHWFQNHALTYLRSLKTPDKDPPVLFAYSYTALSLLHYAKKQGWKTVLGQINPGLIEEQIVSEAYNRHPSLAPHREPIPSGYWQSWKQECELADTIVVNSNWSRQLLLQAGVSPQKLEVIPLVYEPSTMAHSFQRTYPEAFSSKRPLRALFLGVLTLRKGMASLLTAIRRLTGEPIEFWLVGPQEIQIPKDLVSHPQVRWIGPIARSQVSTYYQQADVFLFPTLSDGFGLTQLEAQSWKLPIIASKHCGEVVQKDINGIVLSEVSPNEIASSLKALCANPQQLAAYAQNATLSRAFSLNKLQTALCSVTRDRTPPNPLHI